MPIRFHLGYTDCMRKWIEQGAGIALPTIGVLIYIGAKVHFFLRFGQISIGAYLKEHWIFWAGMAIWFLFAWILTRIKAYRERSQSNLTTLNPLVAKNIKPL